MPLGTTCSGGTLSQNEMQLPRRIALHTGSYGVFEFAPSYDGLVHRMSFISYHGMASWCEAIGLSHVASLLPSRAERVSCVRGCSFTQTFLILEHALTPNPSLPLVAPSQDPPHPPPPPPQHCTIQLLFRLQLVQYSFQTHELYLYALRPYAYALRVF